MICGSIWRTGGFSVGSRRLIWCGNTGLGQAIVYEWLTLAYYFSLFSPHLCASTLVSVAVARVDSSGGLRVLQKTKYPKAQEESLGLRKPKYPKAAMLDLAFGFSEILKKERKFFFLLFRKLSESEGHR
jgi:hypothetical protein